MVFGKGHSVSSVPSASPAVGVKGARKEREARKNQTRALVKGLVVVGVAFLATFGSFHVLKLAMGTDYPIVVVTSQSMEPNVHRGDLLFVKSVDPSTIRPSTSYEAKDGDVIIYDTHGLWAIPVDEPVVHRVVEKYFDNATGKWTFVTKGDNDQTNPNADRYPVPEDHVLGKVVGRIPYVGHVKLFLTETSLAIPLVVALSALLLITVAYDVTHPEEDKGGDEGRRGERGEEKAGVAGESGAEGRESEEGKREVDLGV
ncbi:MAG: hypothetical protein Kow0069_09860 [Promethearchaeota archaeon]